jgi:Bacterial low temperature requirement A protein (LtrA)
VFSTRFHSDDIVQRTLTLLQMFAVAAMAANAKEALDPRSSAGFATADAVVRFLLVAQYVRARYVPCGAADNATSRGGAMARVGARSRSRPFWIRAVAFAIDLGHRGSRYGTQCNIQFVLILSLFSFGQAPHTT